MLNKSGVVRANYVSINQILANVELQASIGCIVSESLGVVTGGRKIVKAGTPVSTDYSDLQTAAVAAGETKEATGVLLHDVDVTNGNANGTLLIFGFVNTNRLDESVQALITETVKEELKGKVTFLSV